MPYHKRTRSPLSFISTLFMVVAFVIGWKMALHFNAPLIDDDPKNPIDVLTNSNVPPTTAEQLDLELFWNVHHILKNNYINEEALSTESMLYGAIKGLTASLDDPYTVFMSPTETEEFQNSLNGELEGIGAELTVENGLLTIVTPLKGSPAERAGLQTGDIIYKIEDEFAADLPLFDAIMKIRGPRGTPVSLTLFREGLNEPLEVTITRARIEIESVTWEEKENQIAYISINQFSDSTKIEFQKIVSEVLLIQPKGIILDLRNNGGGYLDIAVDILAEFISGKKPVVTMKQRDPSKNEIVYVSGDARLPEVPLIVLVNNGSASASEIVAGAIQDLKRGIIMGTQTFGKGNVQEIDLLEDGSSLRITIAKWYTPNDRSIDHIGITPDQLVEFTEEDFLAERDPQLDTAIEYLSELTP